ncbi:hypothetical protein GCK72_001882 [Caenorhabditis remanei]|uniref:Cyclin-like domain-containing protein n=1 Tax=Caenorhabditis remanei TaxID=31234 RepID=A0A6A5HR34_CAERE|nr:hypothetical protein GCK72_001882 [Caenorhabditis remanei]KAF1770065.1 hypothetical protein GCK72_001882 [Caenorhabditis remanei]
MTGRKSSRTDSVPAQKVERKSAILSPHDELRERLLETAIDVKENIPERRKSSRNESVGSQKSDCSDSRKRHSTEKGPAAKRHSNEKLRNDDREASYSSTGSVSSRPRGRPLPMMPEEEEVFDDESSSDHHAESEESHEMARSDDQYDDDEDYEEGPQEEDGEDEDVDDEEDYEDLEDEGEEDVEDETEDEDDLPVQNTDFAVTKRLMNGDHLIDPPILLSASKCEGIGSPTKVWSLMVKRDEIPRATRQLLRNHPEMTVAMRRLLVDWMMEVCESEKLHRETFHLAVDYVDRYLESSKDECSHNTFQLVGTAALFIAAKYEEIYPPKCAEFAALTDGAFSANDIRQMEILIVKDIGWSLGPITSIQWLSTFLQLLGTGRKVTPDKVNDGNMYVPEFLRSEYTQMCKILDYLLSEIDSFNFTYRTIAAAVLFVNYEPRSAVEKATGLNHEQLQNVIEYVLPICRAFAKHDKNSFDENMEPDCSLKSDDSHNIQVHIKQSDIDPYVIAERERQKQNGPQRRL